MSNLKTKLLNAKVEITREFLKNTSLYLQRTKEEQKKINDSNDYFIFAFCSEKSNNNIVEDIRRVMPFCDYTERNIMSHC